MLRARVAELEAQLAARELYVASFERSHVMLCVAEPDGHFTRLNLAWERALGWSLDELRSRPFLDFVHPDDAHATREAVTAVTRGEVASGFEGRFRCKDGSYRHLRWFAPPVDESGLLHAVAEDITAERMAEDRARVYEGAVQSSAMGFVVLEVERSGDPASLRLLMANAAAAKATGVDFRSEVGRRLIDILPGIHQTDMPTIYADVALSGCARELGEIVYGDARMEQSTFSAKAFQIAERRVCVAFENITDRKRAEETLRQNIRQEELIRAQAAALAELSTPLIPLNDEVVVMPLVGAVDERRANQMIETLLSGIAGRRVKAAILDITGVAVVDTHVADALVRAARGVKLLGARAMLTGIRPDVARTLVELAVDLGGIQTYGSLQAGIAAALTT
jgi:rsbT co-antagonist protein RsbR